MLEVLELDLKMNHQILEALESKRKVREKICGALEDMSDHQHHRL